VAFTLFFFSLVAFRYAAARLSDARARAAAEEADASR
jgi:hypothetical protein